MISITLYQEKTHIVLNGNTVERTTLINDMSIVVSDLLKEVGKPVIDLYCEVWPNITKNEEHISNLIRRIEIDNISVRFESIDKGIIDALNNTKKKNSIITLIIGHKVSHDEYSYISDIIKSGKLNFLEISVVLYDSILQQIKDCKVRTLDITIDYDFINFNDVFDLIDKSVIHCLSITIKYCHYDTVAYKKITDLIRHVYDSRVVGFTLTFYKSWMSADISEYEHFIISNPPPERMTGFYITDLFQKPQNIEAINNVLKHNYSLLRFHMLPTCPNYIDRNIQITWQNVHQKLYDFAISLAPHFMKLLSPYELVEIFNYTNEYYHLVPYKKKIDLLFGVYRSIEKLAQSRSDDDQHKIS